MGRFSSIGNSAARSRLTTTKHLTSAQIFMFWNFCGHAQMFPIYPAQNTPCHYYNLAYMCRFSIFGVFAVMCRFCRNVQN